MTTVRMSDIWDRATSVVAGRAAIMTGLALTLIWLPALVQRAVQFAIGTPGHFAGGVGAALVFALVGIAAAVLGIIGHLALVAIASDPTVDRREGVRIALRRFWPYLGLVLLLALAGIVLLIPVAAVVIAAYPGMAAMRAGIPPQIGAGAGLFLLVYMVAGFVLGLWLEARLLIVLTPVIVNERLGLGSYRRAFHLTRGLAWRIVGVVLLFAVVAIIGIIAAQSVVGIVFRLLLGAPNIALALFLTGAVVSLVTTGLSVIVSAFTAQLYVATRDAAALR